MYGWIYTDVAEGEGRLLLLATAISRTDLLFEFNHYSVRIRPGAKSLLFTPHHIKYNVTVPVALYVNGYFFGKPSVRLHCLSRR